MLERIIKAYGVSMMMVDIIAELSYGSCVRTPGADD